ncbi:MAG: argininosuccinate synthase [Sporocytophaga sp.]|uniref:argininosuccinate synthase n=1 Tax=Sporocytophaga sp. TaxID=2231183 RepID=UPI001B04E018|nr:argininosuccinate synthase [Sporocytophaga sp.]MBO9699796.1 argininosuccinate synthase [Sporocytophaga sp.]
MSKKVVLAFSGGLDTSYCVKYLSEEKGLEIHSAIVNTGGFTKEELKEIEAKAYKLGVKTHVTLDVVDKFYKDCVKYLIFGNILKNNTYPLSVSAERVFQATAIADYCKQVNADFVAHGSTGAGNDQVRFDMIFNILIPNVGIITPIRDMKLSREAEIEYLKSKGVVSDWTKAAYSINKGIWGTSVGGKETLTSGQYLPEAAFPTQVTKTAAEEVELTFEKGELVGINGQKLSPVDAILKLNDIAAPFGIGRDIHVGDTIIGIKGRVGFEAAAPMVIIKAHHTLEKHTLTKWQTYWKEQLSGWYGNFVHEGQFLEPVMRNIEQFLDDSQKFVSGKVKVYLAPYRFHVIGIESSHDLMSSKFGSYGEMNNAWSGEDVKGFSKIFGNQTMIFHKVNN